MTVLAHVGPECSWDVLREFMTGATQSLVSAMYEFRGVDIANTLQERLENRVSLKLEAVGDAPPPGYERVRLADPLSDDS